MEEHFANVQHHESDVYVADYTQLASEHPELVVRGVVISNSRPELIDALVFHNPNGVRILSVNFEKNKAVFQPEGGETVSNCECMLVSEQGNSKRWLALAELKYCKGADRNIASNFESALCQLKDTFLFLRDQVELFGQNEYRYYWIVSMPEHSERVPFSAFVLTPDELIEYKDKYNAVIISDNVVEVWTGTVIKMPIYKDS